MYLTLFIYFFQIIIEVGIEYFPSNNRVPPFNRTNKAKHSYILECICFCSQIPVSSHAILQPNVLHAMVATPPTTKVVPIFKKLKHINPSHIGEISYQLLHPTVILLKPLLVPPPPSFHIMLMSPPLFKIVLNFLQILKRN